MGDLDKGSFRADQHVYPVAVLPEMSDLDQVEVARPAQRVNYVFADGGGEMLALLFLLRPPLLIFVLRGHSYSRS